MNEIQALTHCLNQWTFISEEIKNFSLFDVDQLKEMYCIRINQRDWSFDCAMCAYTNLECENCPLLNLWGGLTGEHDYPCCQSSSPYVLADKYSDILECQKIVDACNLQLEWWAALKEMNR